MLLRVGLLILAGGGPVAGLLTAQAGVTVRGKLTVSEKGSKQAADVADAVIWLEGGRGVSRPADLEVVTQRKTFTPSIVVAPVGSQIAFPNRDPFNHNVFSRSDEAPFDLGLYGRDQTRSARFSKPGITRVYCNIHAQMWAVVVAVESPFVARPGADGLFQIPDVPPGTYRLQVWHDRGGRTSRTVDVGPAGAGDLILSLDASAFKAVPHLNKFGKPYDSEGRRYE